MRIRCSLVVVVLLIVSGCSSSVPAVTETTPPSSLPPATSTTPPADTTITGTVRLLFAGDVMLGRRVAPVAAAEGPDLFRDLRYVVSNADIAAANLESPLTFRPHESDNPNALEADPATAELLAKAGFDLLSVANNHSGDAGAGGFGDTLDALEAAGLQPLGVVASSIADQQPLIEERAGVTIAFVAFDITGLGIRADRSHAGTARYSPEDARSVVEDAADEAEVVVVSVHGGVEYLPDTDPILADVAADLVTWGADVVWGHGPHVSQPVSVVSTPTGSRAIVATSLGNLLFDQQRPATQVGSILEVLVSENGVVAFRVGCADHAELRPRFVGWDLPEGSAALLNGEWWSLAGRLEPVAADVVAVPEFAMGDVTTAGLGDVTGDGHADLVVSYRHPFRANAVNQLYTDRTWTDVEGRSAHLGVFDPVTLRPRWAAGTLLRPVARLAVCEGALALAFDSLDDPHVVATGGWQWWDFGFAVAPELPGEGVPACADIDRDGLADPVIARR
jgi:poly-gamma-glutamate synthesis protein (capsule biosynthesis protein)